MTKYKGSYPDSYQATVARLRSDYVAAVKEYTRFNKFVQADQDSLYINIWLQGRYEGKKSKVVIDSERTYANALRLIMGLEGDFRKKADTIKDTAFRIFDRKFSNIEARERAKEAFLDIL